MVTRHGAGLRRIQPHIRKVLADLVRRFRDGVLHDHLRNGLDNLRRQLLIRLQKLAVPLQIGPRHPACAG